MKVIPTGVTAEKPQGSPFYIDSCRFRFGEQLDVTTLELDEDKVVNWPMIYILANDESSYVGQTTSVATRINQHGANEEKKDFLSVSIIFNEEFNASVVTDYEHRLIGLMHADGRYRLTNKNDGMTDTNYFSKSRYSEMFEDLWEELRRLELAEHSIQQIEESEVFKYSPYKGLTTDQKVALDKILRTVEESLAASKPIVVEGMPGTGKTILAIFLLKTLKDDPRYRGLNIKLLEPVSSLRGTLKKSLRGVLNLDESDIIGPSDIVKSKYGYKAGMKGNIDILLVDEAHRLKQRKNIVGYKSFDDTCRALGLPESSDQLDWVLDQAKLPVLFYDPLQVVGPSGISENRIAAKMKESFLNPIVLDTQMRVKGGKGYLDYVLAILNDEDPAPRVFDEYEFVLHEGFADFTEHFESSISKYNLTRMIAGFAWSWETKKDKSPTAYDMEIEGQKLRWNCKQENWVGLGIDDPKIAHEVGCIHSIQGYDLSYAYVIIGRDIRFNPKTGKLVANKVNYFDRNGYSGATQEQLTQYIKNIYYVLLTRGIRGTHIYVCDPILRNHLSKFFPKVI